MVELFTRTANNDQLTSANLNAQLSQLEAAIIDRQLSFANLVPYTTLGANSTLIDIQNIPQTYKNLWILLTLGSTNSNLPPNFSSLTAYFNNSTTAADYASQTVWSQGAGDIYSNNAAGAVGYIELGRVELAGLFPDFNPFIIDIMDYTSTAVWKTVQALSGYNVGNSIGIQFGGGTWNQASAIDRITFKLHNAFDFVAGCSYSVYGYN